MAGNSLSDNIGALGTRIGYWVALYHTDVLKGDIYLPFPVITRPYSMLFLELGD